MYVPDVFDIVDGNIEMVDELFKELKPGISSHADHPEEVRSISIFPWNICINYSGRM